MAKVKKRLDVAEYRPPSQRERIRDDSRMMADSIINKDPRVVRAKEKLARQLESDAVKRARTRPKI